MKEAVQIIDAALGTQEAHLFVEHAKLRALQDDNQGMSAFARHGAMLAIEAVIDSIKKTRESLPK